MQFCNFLCIIFLDNRKIDKGDFRNPVYIAEKIHSINSYFFVGLRIKKPLKRTHASQTIF